MKKIIVMSFLLVAFVCVPLVHAAELYQAGEQPVDTDADGLTDQGEVQLFKTNPSNIDTDRDGMYDSTEVLLGSDPNDAASRPVVKSPEEVEVPSSWPWYITRGSGLASYLLLWLMVVVGVGLSTNILYRFFSPTALWAFHRTLGLSLAGTISLHVAGLIFDEFAHLTLLEIFVPLYSHFQTTLMSLGIIGFYVAIPILVTSVFSIVKQSWLWRLTHYLAFPMYASLLVHGLMIGTDRQTPIVATMYWVTGLTVASLVVWRIAWSWWTRRQVLETQRASA